jgi:hypothetical protein
MKRLLLVLMLFGCALLGFARGVIAQTPPETESPHFQAAQTISVTDVTIPTNCLVSGTVVIDALITEEGKPQEVEVRRDIPCLTELALDAVKEWKFTPAKVGENAVASRIAVAVTFSPQRVLTDPIPLPALKPQSDAAIQAEFQPAEVTRAKIPAYPIDAAVDGTVVLEVNLNAQGEPGDVKVLQDLPPFTSHTQAVVADWRFMAATDNGNPIPSKIVLAFVFRPLISDSY